MPDGHEEGQAAVEQQRDCRWRAQSAKTEVRKRDSQGAVAAGLRPLGNMQTHWCHEFAVSQTCAEIASGGCHASKHKESRGQYAAIRPRLYHSLHSADFSRPGTKR